eukprot:4225069-Ditylum_brightwellii.AAC.1
MPPGMDMALGELIDEEAIPELLRRSECADDKELDNEEEDGENNLDETFPPDIKGDPEDYLEDLYNNMVK